MPNQVNDMDYATQSSVDQSIADAMKFTTAKYGDTPTDAQQLANKKYVDNKLYPPRVISITTSASYAVDSNSYDALSITALGGTINTLGASGSPTDFQKLIIRIKDNGLAQTIIWSTSFVSYGSTLPTVTVAGKILSMGFIYDAVAAKWGCVAVQQQP